MKTCIIIPTYNERDNIAKLVGEIFVSLPETDVLVVDDSSPDGTAQVVRLLQQEFRKLRLIRRTGPRSFGRSYIDGFNAVLANDRFDVVGMMDGDCSHDPKYLPELVGLSTDFDVVIGSRYVKGGGVEGWELWRKSLSFFGNLYCRILTRVPIRDFTSGFQIIRTDILKKIDFSIWICPVTRS